MSSSRKSIFLVGPASETITGHKLPSNRQVLSLVFFHTLYNSAPLRQAAKCAFDAIAPFWHKARIPIRAEKHCIVKIEKLHDDLQSIQKSSLRKNKNQEQREEAFKDCLDDLFDIAAANALDKITIQEDKDFLILQREKGRPGHMSGVDRELAMREERSAERLRKEEERRAKHLRSTASDFASVSTEAIPIGDSHDDTCNEPDDDVYSPTSSLATKRRRPKNDFMTPKLAAALDRAKVSNPMATMILSAMIESCGLDVSEFAINVSSIRNARDRLREQRSNTIRSNFTENAGDYHTVHFDGKRLKDPKTGKYKETVPVLLTGRKSDQLLGSPEVSSGTGEDTAIKIFELLMEWGAEDVVEAACADTTLVNTGWEHGAIVALEKLLERALLYLACQHHVDEVVLRGVFEHFVASSSGPEISLFVRFKEDWNSLNTLLYTPGISEPAVVQALQGKEKDIIQYAVQQLQEFHSRADYRELLELTVIYLGGIPPGGARFHQPGAVSDARFMSKAIYCIKIALFKDQFRLSKHQLEGIKQVCVFVVRFYVKLWFVAPVAAAAPNSVLDFLRDVLSFSPINPVLVDLVFKKMSGHLWYLSQECVSLAFFDPNVSPQVKEKMRFALQREPWDEPKKRFEASPEALKNLIIENDLDYFVSKKSLSFFQRFRLSTDFLSVSADLWNTEATFQAGLSVVQSIQVTNDVAERAVALSQAYHQILTESESQRENIMLIVSEHRKAFPDFRKSTLTKEF